MRSSPKKNFNNSNFFIFKLKVHFYEFERSTLNVDFKLLTEIKRHSVIEYLYECYKLLNYK